MTETGVGSGHIQPTLQWAAAEAAGQGTKKLSLEKPTFLFLLHRSPETGLCQASCSSESLHLGFPPVKWEQYLPSLQEHLEDKYSKF